jgi:hypothetical protein
MLTTSVSVAEVTPSVYSFEIDGDYGSTIQTNGDIYDDGNYSGYYFMGSGQLWTHITNPVPYMGTNCYAARCTASPSSGNDRSEQKMMNQWCLSDGARFFSLSFCVPSSTPTATNWLFFCQWWQDPDRQPPLTIGWGSGHVQLARRYDGDSFDCLYDDGTLVKDTWYHFLIQVGFGFNNTGIVGLWKMNLATGDWEQKYFNNAITLGFQYDPDGVTPANTNDFSWKVGTYRGSCSFETKVYYDNIRYGRRWADVTKGTLTGYHKNVMELQLDETSGTVANDASVFNNDGTLVGGPIWQTNGVVGNCLKFDGTDDNVRVPVDTLDFDFGNYLTASGWFKTTNSQTAQAILCMDEYSTTYKFRLYLADSSNLVFTVRHPDNTLSAVQKTVSNSVFNGQWHHFAGTYNRWAADGNRLKLYLDGVKIASSAGSGKPLWRGNNYLYVGRFSGSYFKGYIDEIGLYNYAMTDAEISALYN